MTDNELLSATEKLLKTNPGIVVLLSKRLHDLAFEQLTAERDKLLAALKMIAACEPDRYFLDKVREISRSAIEVVEGKQTS